jgi:hypothetical protein
MRHTSNIIICNLNFYIKLLPQFNIFSSYLQKVMFNAIKIWKKWKASPPRSLYCSTGQSQPQYQHCYSHHSKCSYASKIFLWLHQLPYLSQQLSGSLCNIHSQARSQMKQQDYIKHHQLPEISQLYSEDGLMHCLTVQL